MVKGYLVVFLFECLLDLVTRVLSLPNHDLTTVVSKIIRCNEVQDMILEAALSAPLNP